MENELEMVIELNNAEARHMSKEITAQLSLDSVIFIAIWAKRNLVASEQRGFFDYLLTLDATYVDNMELGTLYGRFIQEKQTVSEVKS